jgi:hypothetical protein
MVRRSLRDSSIGLTLSAEGIMPRVVAGSIPTEFCRVASQCIGWWLIPSSIQKTMEEGENLRGTGKVPGFVASLNMRTSEGNLFLWKKTSW